MWLARLPYSPTQWHFQITVFWSICECLRLIVIKYIQILSSLATNKKFTRYFTCDHKCSLTHQIKLKIYPGAWVHPLTWLHYLGYTIYGNEGHISTLLDGPEVEYYQADTPPGIYYYYVSQGELALWGPLLCTACPSSYYHCPNLPERDQIFKWGSGFY